LEQSPEKLTILVAAAKVRTLWCVSVRRTRYYCPVERTPQDRIVEYRLTAEADELRPVLQALYSWGERRAAQENIKIEPAV
jgi:hypothetical protein